MNESAPARGGEPQVIIISAMSKDRVIGAGAGMPWSVPDEYQQFLDFVRGNTVVMGRRSFEIFGPDLTESYNIVVSRSQPAFDNAEVASSLEDALESAKSRGRPVYVAGGGTIYKQALPYADALYLSIIKGDFDGDTYFPELDSGAFEEVERRPGPAFDFVVYRARRQA